MNRLSGAIYQDSSGVNRVIDWLKSKAQLSQPSPINTIAPDEDGG